VTVNAVAPGAVLLPDGWGADAVTQTIESTPLGRLGTPADVAEAVKFLLAADYVTGTTLITDGGKFIR
jgi:pteridine reductase